MRSLICAVTLFGIGVRAHTCQDICEGASSCSKGSYCKSWQSIPVCYGLYYADAEFQTVCYFPDDPLCPETYPVDCPTDHPEVLLLNETAASDNVGGAGPLENSSISLAETVLNSTLETVSLPNNRTPNIQVFDWVPDEGSKINNSLSAQL